MKRKNMTKRIFACGLAVAIALTTVSIIPTPAQAAKKTSKKAKKNKKAAKKTLSISKKKLTIVAGKKAKLNVKKATKKVKWSTNKKKVVKIVKSTGKKKTKTTIKALKAGKAVVTAKVGKKKLKCKVTVKAKSPSLKSVAVDKYDGSCVIVTLKKKFALNISDFQVSTKDYDKGSFYDNCSLMTMTTEDFKTYYLYLTKTVGNGDYVKLTAKGASKTAQYKKEFYADYNGEKEVFEKTGELFFYYCSDLFVNGIGYEKYTIDGTLPEGLVYDANDKCIYGKMTANGEFTVTVEATDELGRSASSKLTIKAYSDSVIAATKGAIDIDMNDELQKRATLITESNKTLPDDEKQYLAAVDIEAMGGSGKYIFTLATPDNAEVCLSTDKTDFATKQVTHKPATETSLNIPYSIAEGEHTYTITVADAVDSTRVCTTTVTVNVAKNYRMTGTVKDTKGTDLSSGTIYFIPSDAKGLYDAITTDIDSYSNGDVPGDAKGTYSVSLKPDTYTVKVYSNGIYYHVSKTVKVEKKDTKADIKVPIRLYTVSGTVVYANEENALRYKTLYFEMKDYKYESIFFRAYTDDKGNFIVSLPDGQYVMYFVDEYGNRQYLDKEIVVNEKDMSAGTLKASISRYSVEGIVYNATSVDTLTGAMQTLNNTNLYFYNADGEVITASTDSRGVYNVYLEGADTPGLSYKVRANFGGAVRTLGTVTVTTANQENTSFKYTFANEQAEVKDITLETKTTLTSTGNNDLIGKFTVAADGSYDVKIEDAVYSARVVVFDNNGMVVGSEHSTDVNIRLDNLKAGETYFVKVLPFEDGDQQICTVDLLVEKRKTPQDLATVIAVGSSQDVTVDSYETKLIKLSLEAGKTYSLSFTDDEVYRCAFENYGMSGNEYIDYDYIYADDEYTFSVDETGDYYFCVNYYDSSFDIMTATATISFREV